MKTRIEVDISKISIQQYYFSFNYKIMINGQLKHEGVYESDHAWGDDRKNFRALLKDGEAAKLALQYAL